MFLAGRTRSQQSLKRSNSLGPQLLALTVSVACASPTPLNDARGPLPPNATGPAARSDASSTAPQPDSLTLSLIGINDVHGQLERLPILGGYVNNLRTARRADAGEVLLIDAGDVFQGSLASNLGEGAPMVQAYNALGVAAAALGNHEFDFGPAGPAVTPQERQAPLDPRGALQARLREAHFPWLSANLVDTERGSIPLWQNLAASTIITLRSGIRVGIIGALTAQTPKIVFPGWFKGLSVAPLAPSIEAEARRLRSAGVSLVVVAAHAGAKCTNFDDPDNLSSCDDGEIFQVVRALPASLVDVVFAGHTHEGVAQRVNGVVIAEAYLKLKAFSRVDVTLRLNAKPTPALDSGANTAPKSSPPLAQVSQIRVFPPQALCSDTPDAANACKNTEYAGATVLPDKNVELAIQPALLASQRESQRWLGVDLPKDLEPEDDKESALGNFIADLMLLATPVRADLALLNSGGLRARLAKGPLTFGAMYASQPFDNRLVQVEISGRALKASLLRNLEAEHPGIVCVAGVRVEVTCRNGVSALVLRRRDGRLISDRETLSVVTSDYLATGGDGLLAAAELVGPTQDLGAFFRDALIAALQAHKASLPALTSPSDIPRLRLPMARPVSCRQQRPTDDKTL